MRRLRYHVISEDIVRRISTGDIADVLPTTRQCCEHYRASSRTILEVWDKLKADGIIVTRPGQGTYVKKRS
jgi:DNA-binding GntR family transcriptional regulator